MRIWVVVVSAVLGAIAGYVGYFLYVVAPTVDRNVWWTMIAGGAFGLLVGVATWRFAKRTAEPS